MPWYKYDIFICHAVEDRAITEAVYKGLKKAGFKVWYSGVDMEVGRDMNRILTDIIPSCRFGVLILSEAFIASSWTNRELYVLEQRNDREIILPVLHKISASRVRERFPFLRMDHFAINALKEDDYGVGKLIKAIKAYKKRTTRKQVVATLLVLISLIGAAFVWIEFPNNDWFEQQEVQKEQMGEFMGFVEMRVKDFQTRLLTEYAARMRDYNGEPIEKNELLTIYNKATARKSRYRNEYHFSNGYSKISGRKNFIKAGLSDPDSEPYLAHGLQKYKCYLLHQDKEAYSSTLSYLFINDAEVEFESKLSRYLNDSSVQVQVQYKEPIRSVFTNISFFGEKREGIKRSVHFIGFKPIELYTFRKRNNSWILFSVN